MPSICTVFGCKNRANKERTTRFFRVPKVIASNGKRVKEFTTRRRNKWLLNLLLQSQGAESKFARVCSDHFVKGILISLFAISLHILM